MSDVLDNNIAVSEQKEPAATHRPHEQTIEGTRLAGNMFGVEVSETEEKKEETNQAQQEVKKEEVATQEPVKDTPPEWFKNYGWDSEDLAKTEIESLKKLKDSSQEKPEFNFENEESKRLADAINKGDRKKVLEILRTQDEVESYLTGEVTKDNADNIIKLGMKLKYKDLQLSDSEISYKFNKQYGIPAEPVQGADELDEDFSARKSQWQATVSDIEMSKIIDAKLMRPDLEQAKTKLVLPDIQGEQQQPVKLTPEQVAANKKFDEAYLSSVEQAVKDFSGFSLKVKNEDVGLPEISVAYTAADTEKVSLSGELKDWVNKSYDANALFDQRWVNKDGTVNTKQMAEDRYLLANRDAIFQKLADETAKKTIEAYVKGKKNISIKEGTPNANNLQRDEKTDLDKVRDMVFA